MVKSSGKAKVQGKKVKSKENGTVKDTSNGELNKEWDLYFDDTNPDKKKLRGVASFHK